MDDLKKIRIEMEPETLVRLLKNKQVFASEMRYLDSGSKHLVRKICLSNCLVRIS